MHDSVRRWPFSEIHRDKSAIWVWIPEHLIPNVVMCVNKLMMVSSKLHTTSTESVVSRTLMRQNMQRAGELLTEPSSELQMRHLTSSPCPRISCLWHFWMVSPNQNPYEVATPKHWHNTIHDPNKELLHKFLSYKRNK
jgi:hypothetical protein